MSDSGISMAPPLPRHVPARRSTAALEVDQIEITYFQRDYAQGRVRMGEPPPSAASSWTPSTALDRGRTRIGLDFIYGEVRDVTFEPLDGQQRLTTLFLLHWYLASRCGALDDAQRWRKFTYATRPSARRFCKRIVECPLPADWARPPSAWITDRDWYLHLWRFDPTIRAMLVTLDAIAKRFADEDAGALWGRLTDKDQAGHLVPAAAHRRDGRS